MARVKVQSVTPSGGKGLNKRELYATVCWYYPQYTLEQVSKMPARDVRLLLSIARREEAKKNYNLVQIVASPHSKKGENVKKLLEHFEKMAKE